MKTGESRFSSRFLARSGLSSPPCRFHSLRLLFQLSSRRAARDLGLCLFAGSGVRTAWRRRRWCNFHLGTTSCQLSSATTAVCCCCYSQTLSILLRCTSTSPRRYTDRRLPIRTSKTLVHCRSYKPPISPPALDPS